MVRFSILEGNTEWGTLEVWNGFDIGLKEHFISSALAVTLFYGAQFWSIFKKPKELSMVKGRKPGVRWVENT